MISRIDLPNTSSAESHKGLPHRRSMIDAPSGDMLTMASLGGFDDRSKVRALQRCSRNRRERWLKLIGKPPDAHDGRCAPLASSCSIVLTSEWRASRYHSLAAIRSDGTGGRRPGYGSKVGRSLQPHEYIRQSRERLDRTELSDRCRFAQSSDCLVKSNIPREMSASGPN